MVTTFRTVVIVQTTKTFAVNTYFREGNDCFLGLCFWWTHLIVGSIFMYADCGSVMSAVGGVTSHAKNPNH